MIHSAVFVRAVSLPELPSCHGPAMRKIVKMSGIQEKEGESEESI